MRFIAVALVAFLVAVQPAHAHRLKVFATVEDGVVTGYAFFVGGGRPKGATLIIRNAAGTELYRGATDDEGGFAWRPPQPLDLAVVVDARDGHVAEARLAATRFAGTGGALAAEPAEAATHDASPAARDAAGIDQAALVEMIDRSVDRAVSRQMRPLLEAYEEADGKIRFNDVIGGIGMIVGLIGVALWATTRRRARRSAPPEGG
ncbi:MAG: cobalamin biosynthesis protein CbiM [Alphaproteobacteria bacterium]